MIISSIFMINLTIMYNKIVSFLIFFPSFSLLICQISYVYKWNENVENKI